AARRLRADIYHFHDPELLPLGLLLRFSRARVVYDAHEHLADNILSKHYVPDALRGPVSLIVGRCELFAARGLNAIVAATPYILQRFQKVPTLSAGVYNFPLAEEMSATGSWDSREMQA